MVEENIFSLIPSGGGRLSSVAKLKRVFLRPAERLIGLKAVGDIHVRAQALAAADPEGGFWGKILDAMQVSLKVSDHDLVRIPASGPLLVVANHPYGGIEGVILAALLGRVRPDVKLMANYILARIPELRSSIFSVDPFGGEGAARRNVAALRDSVRWLRDGNALGVFPAGEVSSLNLKLRAITDPRWSPTIARLVRKTGASVLPVYFNGANGRLFQAAGLVHPRLRTALLPREFINKSGSTIELRIGKPISAKRLCEYEDDAKMLSYMRLRTYVMANRNPGSIAIMTDPVCPEKDAKPIVAARDADLLEREVETLARDQILVETEECVVCWARRSDVPQIVYEIGRLREITFRQVGEGTGHEIDLDRFDDYYLHLFVWNKVKREIVGAYRLGQSDVILNRYGKKGLYTNTLFKYRSQLLKSISPALEMGRSFVRPEYQKSYAPLMLLWRGIGTYVARNPEYKNLFGPVSVNNGYQSFTRRLMMDFLKMNNYHCGLSRLVRAKTPMPNTRKHVTAGGETLSCIGSLEDLSEMVADIETSQREIPILLKQYLKLGGELLGFNIDPDFNDVLDGLILVDLTKTAPRMMGRYMGKAELEAFLAYHRAAAKKARLAAIAVATTPLGI